MHECISHANRVANVVWSAEHKKVKKLLRFLTQLRQEEKASKARSKARVLIFCNRIKAVKFVESTLRKHHHRCAQMSSGAPPLTPADPVIRADRAADRAVGPAAMGQQQRERVLGDFRCGKLPVLVATDVAGRGLDLRGNRPPPR